MFRDYGLIDITHPLPEVQSINHFVVDEPYRVVSC